MPTLSDYIATEVTQAQFDIELAAYLELNPNIQSMYEECNFKFENLPESIRQMIMQSLNVEAVIFYNRMADLPD